MSEGILGGSWVVISRVINRVTILITLLRGLITPLITTHEPPSRDSALGFRSWGSAAEVAFVWWVSFQVSFLVLLVGLL